MEIRDSSIFSEHQAKFSILYCATQYEHQILDTFGSNVSTLKKFANYTYIFDAVKDLSIYDVNVNILIEVSPLKSDEAFKLVDDLKNNWLSRNITVIFILTEADHIISQKAFKSGVSDCYSPEFEFGDILLRMQFIQNYKILHSRLNGLPQEPNEQYKIPATKRLLDLILSIAAMLVLSPVYLIVAILIKLDSKGPVFYASKRVGSGYQIFDFYKFRSMRINADKEVENLKKDNQYGDSAFFKMKNDPRITKLGNFLRNSSIDELPQLYNVFKGNMSLVGNRPLPLYEAEQLTTDEWSMRFLGPAGITGLWQITKRGKKDMSDRERKKFDNFYNKKFSIWLDLKILLLTIPALFQKEKV